MKKLVVFTTLFSAILLSACGGDPCTKLSEFEQKYKELEETCEEGYYGDSCRMKLRDKYQEQKKEYKDKYEDKCYAKLESELSTLDSEAVKAKCEDKSLENHQYYGETVPCKRIAEEKHKIWKENWDKWHKKSKDEQLKELASSEGTDWKAQVCNKNELSLSTFTISTEMSIHTFTINPKDKPTGYIMLDFVVTDNVLGREDYIYLNKKEYSSLGFIESSGRDVKTDPSNFHRNFSNADDPQTFKFLKNDYGRIIWTIKEDHALPDIHTLKLRNIVDPFSESSLYSVKVDSTWNCTEMTAKDVFEKKDLKPSANAPTPAANEAAAQAAPAGNPDTPDKSIASQLAKRVMNEIRLEEGKSVGQFFSIKKALKPCQKAPDSCADMIKPLVDESLFKFARGVIAAVLLLNNDNYDEQLAAGVLEALSQEFDSFDKIKEISSKSPVGREIMKASNLSDDIKEQIFYIWYLRQYPYAGEDIWKMQDDPSHTWDEYLKMADKYLPQLVNALD